MNPREANAIVLLSGGLDSATVLYIARDRGLKPFTVSFDYGQRHRVELEMAAALSREAKCPAHIALRLDSNLFRGTALVGSDVPVPQAREIDDSIPVTYVPARNILFLSHALALAESYKIESIFIGVNALDYSGYPDCRPEFLDAFEKMAAIGMKTGQDGRPIKIEAPLVTMSKADIIREGTRLGVDYGRTSSCYDPDPNGKPCGKCDSCQLRAKGFAEAGLDDPLVGKFGPGAGA